MENFALYCDFGIVMIKGVDPEREGCPGPPGWRLGVRLTNPLHKKYVC
jgi:hypothetical protein